MKSAVHSNVSYLIKPNAHSRAGGHFSLSFDERVPCNNGAILNIAHIIKHVMSSATEAELAALYIMAQEAVYIRIMLKEMGHIQLPTPIQTDNAMADAVIHGKVNLNEQKQWTCAFIGSATENAKTSSSSISDLVKPITPTIGPNTTLSLTM
jgi:hypothetical protein